MWAIVTTEENGIFKGGFLNMLAIDISIGKLKPARSKFIGEKSTPICVPSASGGVIFMPKVCWANIPIYANPKAG
jgi:hypothetical protein